MESDEDSRNSSDNDWDDYFSDKDDPDYIPNRSTITSTPNFPKNTRLVDKYKREIHKLKTTNYLLRKKNKKSTNMSIQIKDAITAIPLFTGIKKDLEGFINTCNIYMDLIPEDKKGDLFKVIRSKIVGEGLAKISPLTETNTWNEIKTKLKDKFYKKVSLEYAQEDLNNVLQLQKETIEEYGKKVKKKLRALNDTTNELVDSQEEKTLLRRMNEKLAISKFEQNLKNDTIRILVSAKTKNTLDESITYALQKELSEKTKNKHSCSICGMNNHSASTCRRRTNNNFDNSKNTANSSNKQFSRNTNFQRNQPRNTNQGFSNTENKNSYDNKNSNGNRNYNNGNKNNNNGNFSNYQNGNRNYQNGNRNFQNGNRNPNYNNQNSNNINGNRNVKTMSNQMENETRTVRDAIYEDSLPYQINNIQILAGKTQLKLQIINNEILISLPTSLSDQNLTFCIDTGAQISIIKPNKILDAKIDTHKKINITGVAQNAKLQSLGMVKSLLYCPENSIPHDFHVLNKNFSIKSDGILGNDFLIKARAQINIANGTISISNPIEPFIVNKTENDCSEYFLAIDDYCKHERKIVNTISKNKKSKNPDFYTNLPEDFFFRENYNEFKPNQIIINEPSTFQNANYVSPDYSFTNKKNPITDIRKRTEILMSQSNLNNLTENQIKMIHEIFSEFSDAFYIDGDLLKTTNIYEHSFKLKPDKDVVFVRQYRDTKTRDFKTSPRTSGEGHNREKYKPF